jgi:hypothetical protein
MQIAQFIIDLVLVYGGSAFVFPRTPDVNSPNPSAYEHFASSRPGLKLPFYKNCHGSEQAAVFGCVLLTSYLFLFINFYFNTYKKSPASKKPSPNGQANGHSNGHANG